MEGFSITGDTERGGQNLGFKDEKAEEAEIKVKQWLQKIAVPNDAIKLSPVITICYHANKPEEMFMYEVRKNNQRIVALYFGPINRKYFG